MLINADLGEGCANDESLFALVDWANIACGGHAGDESSIRKACELALEHGVQVGAHPSYPDRAGFGRNKPQIERVQLLDELERQMDLFENIAAQFGCRTAHFKPHGQLYNDAAFLQAEADLVIHLAKAYPHLKLVALAQSPLVDLARAAGVVVVEEAFPDRVYLPNGALAPRSEAGALIEAPQQVKAQALSIIRKGPLICLGGSSRVVMAQTLCVHGDTPQALANAQAVREAVTEHDQDAFSGAD
ncbi:LamB/YcsF family protein [Limnobacter parvus]|uniref:LamB/YcsF family protein n=1 Tax=Limnobacter parvus TaxID=2939690 RepID=A0ABT1XHW8_9BURK|nr:LamB/YcsF family protein [Limnobacter parvus]MCR2746862.1 LamB/YcsF family protein [Limnobacter parvus]